MIIIKLYGQFGFEKAYDESNNRQGGTDMKNKMSGTAAAYRGVTLS
ncbi:hypothetical protein J2X61_004424 [Bacillus sp. 3255]|nr:hypothetical protein [Bacillus sp. 3255]